MLQTTVITFLVIMGLAGWALALGEEIMVDRLKQEIEGLLERIKELETNEVQHDTNQLCTSDRIDR